MLLLFLQCYSFAGIQVFTAFTLTEPEPGSSEPHRLTVDEDYTPAYDAQNEPTGWIYSWYINVDGGIVLDGESVNFYSNGLTNIEVTLQLTKKDDGGLPPLFKELIVLTNNSSGSNSTNNTPAVGERLNVTTGRPEIKCKDNFLFYLATENCDSVNSLDVQFHYKSIEVDKFESPPIKVHLPAALAGMAITDNNTPGSNDRYLSYTIPAGMNGVYTIAVEFIPPENGPGSNNCATNFNVSLTSKSGAICNDTFELSNSILPYGAPYDPNAKIAKPSRIEYNNLPNGSGKIMYTIFFQNTGNASTTCVKIDDILPPHMKVTKEDYIGSSFDSVIDARVSFKPNRTGTTFTWIADRISLKGLDELSENASKLETNSTVGYMQFYAAFNLELSDSCLCLKNTAYIKFKGAKEIINTSGNVLIASTKNHCRDYFCLDETLSWEWRNSRYWFFTRDRWWPSYFTNIKH